MKLAEFYGPPNRVQADPSTADGRIALRGLDEPDDPVVLPWDDGYRGMRWYVMAPAGSFEQLREELLANVGISYTDFRGQPTLLEEGDPGDAAVLRLGSPRQVLRISLVSARDRTAVSDAFWRFLDLWSGRPPAAVPPARSAAEVLREYRLALAAGDRATAEAAVRELRASGAIEVVNLRFLELEVVSHFDGPDAVLEVPELSALLGVRRPARATDIIARAVDRARLRRDHFTLETVRYEFARLDGPLQELLTAPGECRSSSGALLLGLRTEAIGGDVANLLPGLAGALELDAEARSLLEELAYLGDHRAELIAPTVSLGDLLAVGAYDEALELASSGEPSVEKVEVALRCAQWLDSIDSARRALQLLESSPAEVRSRFSGHRLMSSMVDALRQLAQAGAPRPAVHDWNDLFENLWSDPSWAEGTNTAAHGALEWPVRQFFAVRGNATKLAAHIARGASSGSAVFPSVVPHLVEWLDRAPDDSRPAINEVEESIVAYLALDDRTRVGLELLGTYAADVIARGVGADRYDFLLECLAERWKASKSPSTILWVTDLVETVLDQPCPDTARRLSFVSTMLQMAAPFVSRVPTEERELLVNLAGEFGLRDLLPAWEVPGASGAITPRRSLKGIRVALYSLTESALGRREKSSCNGGLE